MKISLVAVLSSFFLCLVLCLILIPLLKKLRAGQNILSYVTEHAEKKGTPTMGGAAFVISSAIVALALSDGERHVFTAVCMGISFMLVGFIDDILKLRHRENEGLKPYQKLIFQFGIAAIAGVYCYINELTLVYFPFTGFVLDTGVWFIPLCIFVFVAVVNGVNLTDGLDGLAASSSLSCFCSFGVLILLQGEFFSLSVLSFALCGGLAAFLIFNTNRAKVFMGDTGSLALGGYLAAIAAFSGNILYIAVIGFVFLLSSLSVIIQVLHYKRTGRRVFLMAPLHHHLQKKGYSECKIAYCYSVVTAVIGCICALFCN